MKLSRKLAVFALALATAGFAFAKDREMTVTKEASTGIFEAYAVVHPLLDGSFDDYVRFSTADLRLVTVALSGSHGVSWDSISLHHGTETDTSFASGDSKTTRSGVKSGGDDTGYYELHLVGKVNDPTWSGNTNTDHDLGEYRVDVTAVHVTPVPEPETFAMLLAGLGIVGWASRRRASLAALTV
ncbi:MAG: FxDxF family PEP-CTERM protein [Comamonadaceae bacterium]